MGMETWAQQLSEEFPNLSERYPMGMETDYSIGVRVGNKQSRRDTQWEWKRKQASYEGERIFRVGEIPNGNGNLFELFGSRAYLLVGEIPNGNGNYPRALPRALQALRSERYPMGMETCSTSQSV